MKACRVFAPPPMLRPMNRILIGLSLLLAMPALARSPDAAAPAKAMVSAADPRAAAAGIAMLKQGGNAMDAIAATLLALSVVEPQSSGIGGGGLLVYQPAGGHIPATFDGREKAPAIDGPRLFLDDSGKPLPRSLAVPGGKSVGIPGNVAMLALAHGKYGKLAWSKLFGPAIALARDGYDVTPRLASAIKGSAATLARQPAAAALFLNPDGSPKAVGTHIVNEPLAQTLEAIAAGGPEAFYHGAIADGIVKAVNTAPTNPTAMTAADLAAYRAKQRAAVCAPYRSYRICSMGPPSAGGIAVIAIVKQLEAFDLGKFGPGSATSWHLLAESERLAFADRAAYGGDSDFVAVPVAGLTSAAYLKARGGLIRADTSMKDALPGTPPGAPKRTLAPGGEIPSTTDFAAADASGNVASLTSTVEGAFGSSLVAGGFVLNNELTDFSFEPEAGGAPVANRVEGGKRPRSSMSPCIVYDSKGRVVLAVGAAGGMTIPAQVAKAIIGVLDWKLPVQEAIALPVLFVAGDLVIAEAGPQGAPLARLLPDLQKLGHRTGVYPLPLKANGIERVPGGWRGGADPRSEGVALGL